MLKQCADTDSDEEHRDVLRQLVSLILETKDGPARNGSLYAQRCLKGMVDIENWLHALGDRHQASLTIGQSMSPEQDQLIQFQQASLGHQHESLGAILTHLVKASYTGIEDFYKVLEHLPKLVKWNSLALHYVPLIVALIAQYGSPDGSSSFREARTLNQRIIDGKGSTTWPLRNLQAATTTWWLAEYSGWFHEPLVGSPMQGMNFEAELEARSKAFFQALKDGAFQCTLSVCSQLKPGDWYEPARNGLTRFLLRDAPALPREVMYNSVYFQDLVMEQVETFVDAFVTNMPDTLREFKTEEDDRGEGFNRLSTTKPEAVYLSKNWTLRDSWSSSLMLLIIVPMRQNLFGAIQKAICTASCSGHPRDSRHLGQRPSVNCSELFPEMKNVLHQRIVSCLRKAVVIHPQGHVGQIPSARL